jgi:hypothetical protein
MFAVKNYDIVTLKSPIFWTFLLVPEVKIERTSIYFFGNETFRGFASIVEWCVLVSRHLVYFLINSRWIAVKSIKSELNNDMPKTTER